MADTISLCFNNAEIMLDCIYEDYESEIENFFDNGHESKVYRWKFKRWVNTYQNYLNDLKFLSNTSEYRFIILTSFNPSSFI